MPRMLATSRVASAGMSLVAARSRALLWELRRRLPEIPNSLVMCSPWIALAACAARTGVATAMACASPGVRGWLLTEFGGNAPVRLAEGDAFAQHQAVGLFGGVNGGVEPDRFLPESERGDGRWQDVERREREIDRAEQRKLQQLQIPLVARGELCRYGERLEETGLRRGGACADQLEHVRILLLRHDGGAGGEAFRQQQEAEFARREEQHVRGEATAVLQQQGELEEQLGFGLAARELHGRHRLVHVREPEPRARLLPVHGQARRAIARGGAERISVDAPQHRLE